MKNIKFVIGCMLIVSILLSSCGNNTTPANRADKERQQEMEIVVEQAEKMVGVPNIKNFTEMKMRKFTYELCDNPKLKTYTYLMDQNGHLHFLCNSIGHGVPYSSRMNNPDKIVNGCLNNNSGHCEPEVLPQAEPNGLFEPMFADATWVLAVDEESGLISPMLVEFPIIVSQFPLKYDSDFRAKDIVATKEHLETHEKIKDFLGVPDEKPKKSKK